MKPINTKYSFFDFIQILSIDIILGTLSIGYMAIRVLQVDANPYWWIVLPLSVWVVYSLDHIIDSYKNNENAVIERHKYHYLHRKQIIFVMIITSVISITLSLAFLEKQIIYLGILLSLFTAIYMGLVYRLKSRIALFQKELIIAIVYTLGIFLAPIVWYGSLPPYPILLIISLIFILAWLEGIMISWFDYGNDFKDGHTSFTIIFGKQKTRRFVILGHALVEIITIIALIILPIEITYWAFLLIFLMNLILGITIMFPHFFAKNNYYRIVGESVFFLPFLLIFA